jgi:hypothetical protein
LAAGYGCRACCRCRRFARATSGKSVSMKYYGACSCSTCRTEFETDLPLSEFQPRICDCQYCQQNPGQLLSHPSAQIRVLADIASQLTANKNGGTSARFYHCKNCNDFVCVGVEIDQRMRGVLNSNLLTDREALGESIPIQPRLLSDQEKLDRWKKLWSHLSFIS